MHVEIAGAPENNFLVGHTVKGYTFTYRKHRVHAGMRLEKMKTRLYARIISDYHLLLL